METALVTELCSICAVTCSILPASEVFYGNRLTAFPFFKQLRGTGKQKKEGICLPFEYENIVFLL